MKKNLLAIIVGCGHHRKEGDAEQEKVEGRQIRYYEIYKLKTWRLLKRAQPSWANYVL